MVSAGLTCAPEIDPIAYTIAIRTSACRRPRSDSVSPRGAEADSIPQMKRTRNIVPTHSTISAPAAFGAGGGAAKRDDALMVRKPPPRAGEAASPARGGHPDRV